METVRIALEAMATRFELVMHGKCATSLRAAGEEALAEIRYLEALLSFYRPTSEISRINQSAHKGPVRVSSHVLKLLKQAATISKRTQGAFDVTVAPLMKCWGFVRGTGSWPDPAAVHRAFSVVGMQHVVLSEQDRTVTFAREGVVIDLGGIGKGYALDQATLILQECGVESAFFHGGTSTVTALGVPPDGEAWRVAVPAPRSRPELPLEPLAVVTLYDEALSVSAAWGKAFEYKGQTYGHVIDPRTGFPVKGAVLSALVHESATTADALSTALMVMGTQERKQAFNDIDKLRYLVAYGARDVATNGITIHAPS